MELWVHWHKTVDSIHSVRVCAYFFSRVSCQYGYITSLYLSAICTINHSFFWLNRYYCIVLFRRWIRPIILHLSSVCSNAMLRRIECVWHLEVAVCLFICSTSFYWFIKWFSFRLLFLLHLLPIQLNLVKLNCFQQVLLFIQKIYDFFSQLNRLFFIIEFLIFKDQVNDFWICGKFRILVRFE